MLITLSCCPPATCMCLMSGMPPCSGEGGAARLGRQPSDLASAPYTAEEADRLAAELLRSKGEPDGAPPMPRKKSLTGGLFKGMFKLPGGGHSRWLPGVQCPCCSIAHMQHVGHSEVSCGVLCETLNSLP